MGCLTRADGQVPRWVVGGGAVLWTSAVPLTRAFVENAGSDTMVTERCGGR